MLGIPHPYLTPSLPGVGGVSKSRPEDFVVEEVPLYAPCGKGEHTYFGVEKVDLSTPEALERLRRALGVLTKDIGYAGLKDRKGVTRQTFSIAGVPPEKVLSLSVPQLKVLWATLHGNKLRVGHLRGNRFDIVVRGVSADSGPRVQAVLDEIERCGLPNYFGPQRFGNRGDAHWVGRDLLRRDDRAAVRRILGHPSTTEHNPHVVEARECFMAGDLARARELFPSAYREERKLLDYLIRAGENYAGARRRLGDASRKLYFTAYQSYLFNVVLCDRLRISGDLGRLFQGDLAFLHRNGAVFLIEDPEAESLRVASFEISPSGPIFGMKMPRPEGAEAQLEREVLEREGLSPAEFHQLLPKLHLEGGRRPFRVRPEEVEWHLDGLDLHMRFFLPKGSYATTLLREVMKNDEVPSAFYEGGEEEKHKLWRPERNSS
jgi:tRNA pseudouridine13 synthase